jgi:hypothetical protein
MGSFQVARPTVQPIEQPDVLNNFAKLQAMRGQAQQQQIQAAQAPYQQQILQEEATQAPIKTQEMQTAARDQQAMTAAMHQWDGKSLDDLPSLVLKNGGSSTAVMGLKQKALEQRQTYSKIAADDATTGSKQIDTLKNKNDMVYGALQSVLQLPDEQLPQALTAKAQELVQQGLLDPQHGQLAQQLAQNNPAAIRQQLSIMEKGLLSTGDLLQQSKAEEEARHNTAIEAQTAATAANTQAYQKARLGIESGRLSLERQKAMIDQNSSTATGDEYLQTLPPGLQAQVKAMAWCSLRWLIGIVAGRIPLHGATC